MWSNGLTCGCCPALSSGVGGWPLNAGAQSGSMRLLPAIPRFWLVGDVEPPFPPTAFASESQTLELKRIAVISGGRHSTHLQNCLLPIDLELL